MYYYIFSLCFVCVSFNAFAQSNTLAINVHEKNDPHNLNPVTSTAANAENIENNIFCRLLDYDRMTFQLTPALATKTPIIEVPQKGNYKGGMSLTYEIRPEATWDDGSPVTGYDYVFTVKAVKHQGVESSKRSTLSFIDEVEVDKDNPKKFTIYSKKMSSMSEMITGYTLHLLPEYIYDPKGVLRTIDFATLADKKSSYSAEVQQFATNFNSHKYSNEVASIKGCGPYELEEWDTGNKIILKRKKEWWGDKVTDRKDFRAYPERIVYHVLTNTSQAITKLEAGELDIVRDVPPKYFFEAKSKESYTSKVTFHDPSQFVYHYLAFNSKNIKLADKRVRQAITHAIDRDKIVQEIFMGAAMKVNTPVSPHRKHYNLNVNVADFDLEKAATLLEKAGWKDTDNDHVLDKIIDGKSVSLHFEYMYPQNDVVRESIGKLAKENLEKIGVKMELLPVEFSLLLEKMKERSYEMMALAWVSSPGSDELKNIWHTSADTKNGGNYVGFGSAKTDKLIDDILVTLDEEKRKALYLEFQERVVDECPYAFLVVPHQLIMIRKGLSYPPLAPISPGYITRLFQQK